MTFILSDLLKFEATGFNNENIYGLKFSIVTIGI